MKSVFFSVEQLVQINRRGNEISDQGFSQRDELLPVAQYTHLLDNRANLQVIQNLIIFNVPGVRQPVVHNLLMFDVLGVRQPVVNNLQMFDVPGVRICHCEGGIDTPLIAPCYCAGSLRYVHQACLQQWIKSSDIRSCELCKYQFIMHSKFKPFSEWEKLEMSNLERRKLMCSITFHIVALTCVIWSLYVLIERTVHEIRHGNIDWPLWTKIIVVAIGFTGALVFMYIQCKAYLHMEGV
uniref:RING-CH-type domain-containing protein n=1 Tax=Timema shepardi TaxID=629360 RepID=A0A7R9AM14_TIMSH|nr:unnamed protein product [Timema shepardi]